MEKRFIHLTVRKRLKSEDFDRKMSARQFDTAIDANCNGIHASISRETGVACLEFYFDGVYHKLEKGEYLKIIAT